MVKKQKIKIGNHYANSWWFPPFFTFSKSIKGTVSFESDFSYNTNKDTNKLIGLSDNFHHHQDSVRIGWRWNNSKNSLEIMSIIYNNSHRTISYLDTISESDLKNKHSFEIKIENSKYVIVFNETKKTFERSSKWKLLRVILKPYFGGKDKAPRTFKFKFNEQR